MIRINLLPPEITEKRKAERLWVYLVFGAVAVGVVLFIFFGVMWLRVNSRSAEVAEMQQESQSLQTQAGAFKVFEDRIADLTARKRTASSALASRVAWPRLVTEVSLVLPTDVWLDSLVLDEQRVTFEGRAIDSQAGGVSNGYKSVAKLLVRLQELDQLQNVWLNASDKGEMLQTPVMHWVIDSSVVKPSAGTTASVPAPPTGP